MFCVLLHNFSSGHTLPIIDSFFCWAIYEKVMGVKRGHFLQCALQRAKLILVQELFSTLVGTKTK